MSTKQDTNKNNNEPSFDEYRAYEELRMIFVIAIETQDFSTIEARISAWENKYPLDSFTDPEIIRKIKAILNKDFLSRLVGDYLAAQILHEQEKQKEAYDSLKKIIDTAKRSKDYKTAEKEIRKWKDNLSSSGLTLYGFDRIYRARICTLLLLPSKELKNQEQATDELKKIKENGSSMNSKDYFEAISNWQNTYSISDFPDKLQNELNQITTEVFDSISQKRTGENAILEIENVLSSKNISLPANAIASILSKYDYRCFDPDTAARIQDLSMEALSLQDAISDNVVLDTTALANFSPQEATALYSLNKILAETPHDMDRILDWIYTNRKISYSEFARNEILSQFLSAGYKVPEQSSYSIPDVNTNLNYTDFSKIDELRESVILNYLGIMSQGDKLSIEGKDNLLEAHTLSAKETLTKKEDIPVMFLEAFDTVVKQPEEESKELDDKATLELEEENKELDDKVALEPEEEPIYNIFIEDIINDPLETYFIQTPSKEQSTNLNEQEKAPEEPKEIQVPEEIQEPQVTSMQENEDDMENDLTSKDNENIEKAYKLSTYVIVATPILAQALEPKQKHPAKKAKKVEKEKIKDL